MAINATAIWRVRPGGNNANGGGYDAAISGAGTDYSQQDTAQLSLTDIACSNTTTVTSATGGFTAAMIGNAIWLTGGGATAGPYFITARASTNSITVDRAPGTISAGSGKVGGARADFWTNMGSTWPVGGNIVYINGAGTDTPSAADYTVAANATVLTGVAGSTSAGYVRFVGTNGRPRIAQGGMFYQYSNCRFEHLYIQKTTTNFTGGSGNGCFFPSGAATVLYDIVFDQGGWVFPLFIGGSAHIILCDIFSSSGTPASTNAGVIYSSGQGSAVVNCFIHDTMGIGISISSGAAQTIANNVFANCGGTALVFNGSEATGSDRFVVLDNTFSGNGGKGGIELTSVASDVFDVAIINNIFANHTGGSAAGITCDAGTAAANALVMPLCEGNQFYNNTANTVNLTLSSSNVVQNPSFGAGTENYTPAAAIGALTFPINRLAGTATTVNSAVVGAIQPAASGSTTYVVNRVTNLFVGDDYAA